MACQATVWYFASVKQKKSLTLFHKVTPLLGFNSVGYSLPVVEKKLPPRLSMVKTIEPPKAKPCLAIKSTWWDNSHLETLRIVFLTSPFPEPQQPSSSSQSPLYRPSGSPLPVSISSRLPNFGIDFPCKSCRRTPTTVSYTQSSHIPCRCIFIHAIMKIHIKTREPSHVWLWQPNAIHWIQMQSLLIRGGKKVLVA